MNNITTYMHKMTHFCTSELKLSYVLARICDYCCGFVLPINALKRAKEFTMFYYNNVLFIMLCSLYDRPNHSD